MNHLQYESSPYLLQHADNPVDWYPWCDGAFQKAEAEDKPVFLSIGYSTCHWCHVMARECFEDVEVAELLNREYVCVKVDREQRPDVDGIYMNACMAMTGSGGWPLTVVMDHAGRPFFAGTYFPKRGRRRMPGLIDILEAISGQWQTDRDELLYSAGRITAHLNAQDRPAGAGVPSDALTETAVKHFKSAYDPKYGGFGRAPKFPSPHNLLFLLEVYQDLRDRRCLEMVEKTLLAMAQGGIFDHIGFGFSRYSTDEKWLAPHFEKMLYDNALLSMAYTKAYEITRKPVYRDVAERTIEYIRREMTHPDGGFYSAQDADSDGVEGRYYVLTPEEITSVLGEAGGRAFCEAYDIAGTGNFDGKSIPNRIGKSPFGESSPPALAKLREYRGARASLHKDDKILTAWNALMIAALADAASVFDDAGYMDMAQRAAGFIDAHLYAGGRLLASYRDGRRSEAGFIDDYAFLIYALLRLYRATIDVRYLERAKTLARQAIGEFFDAGRGGFYLYGSSAETLISRPKECYDGATPSGNSVMSMNLALLSLLGGSREFDDALDRQTAFMNGQAAEHPGGHSFYLLGMLQRDFPGKKITAVLCDSSESERESVKSQLRGRGWTVLLDRQTDEYRLLDGKTTFYVCENNTCYPPTS